MCLIYCLCVVNVICDCVLFVFGKVHPSVVCCVCGSIVCCGFVCLCVCRVVFDWWLEMCFVFVVCLCLEVVFPHVLLLFVRLC